LRRPSAPCGALPLAQPRPSPVAPPIPLPPSWNPETDKHIPVNYSVRNFKAGKAANKVALQKELGLPVDPNIPMMVGGNGGEGAGGGAAR
jgi:hypothetical protein